MKVLFVCRANLGRSQMASAFFDQLSQHTPESAGTIAARIGGEGRTVLQRLQDYPDENATLPMLVDIMNEQGLRISSGRQTQLTPELVDAADRVMVMAQRDSWPDYLVEGEKVTYWDIEDPLNITKETAQQVVDQAKAKVEELVREIG